MLPKLCNVFLGKEAEKTEKEKQTNETKETRAGTLLLTLTLTLIQCEYIMVEHSFDSLCVYGAT